MEKKYPENILPAPITILKYKSKNILFMGSSRAVIFILKKKKPDCIAVKVPDTIKENALISEATQTLKQIVEKQK